MRLGYLLDFNGMTGLESLLLTLFIIVAFFIAGFIIDGVMKNDGFGPYWNGAIAIGGLFAGLVVRSLYFPVHSRYDPVLSMAIVFGVIIFILLFLAAIRKKLA